MKLNLYIYLVVPTNDGSSQSTESRTVDPTSTYLIPSTESPNTNIITTEEQTTEKQTTTSTTTTKQTPSPTTEEKTTSTAKPTTQTETTSTIKTTTAKQSSPAPTLRPTTARPRKPVFVSCDTRSSGCNFVYLRIQADQYPVSCRITNVKVTSAVIQSNVLKLQRQNHIQSHYKEFSVKGCFSYPRLLICVTLIMFVSSITIESGYNGSLPCFPVSAMSLRR